MTISGLRSINNNTTVVGLLVAMGVLPTEEIGGYAALGEMALDGRIGSVAGVLPAAIHAHACERGGIHRRAAAGSPAGYSRLRITTLDRGGRAA